MANLEHVRNFLFDLLIFLVLDVLQLIDIGRIGEHNGIERLYEL